MRKTVKRHSKLRKYLSAFLLIASMCCSLFMIGCSYNQFNANTPEETVDNFLQAIQSQGYTVAKKFYSSNLDNMAGLRNQFEGISPAIADRLFRKIAGFAYTIDNVVYSKSSADNAKVNVTITSYDLGTAFEKMLIEYMKANFQMTFDGATDDDITQKAEDLILSDIEKTSKSFTSSVTIPVSRVGNQWQIDKIGQNKKLLNALSGNIINTLDALSKKINENQFSSQNPQNSSYLASDKNASKRIAHTNRLNNINNNNNTQNTNNNANTVNANTNNANVNTNTNINNLNSNANTNVNNVNNSANTNTNNISGNTNVNSNNATNGVNNTVNKRVQNATGLHDTSISTNDVNNQNNTNDNWSKLIQFLLAPNHHATANH